MLHKYNRYLLLLPPQHFLMFEKIYIEPAGLTEIKGRVIAEGEATGHKHAIEEGILYLDQRGDMFVRVEKEQSRVVHDEHNPITLPRGLYRVRRQREYVGGQVEIVKD